MILSYLLPHLFTQCCNRVSDCAQGMGETRCNRLFQSPSAFSMFLLSRPNASLLPLLRPETGEFHALLPASLLP